MTILYISFFAQVQAESSCRLFLFHPFAHDPRPPWIDQFATVSESVLLQKISALATYQTFSAAWKSEQLPFTPQRQQWLQCVLYYAARDLDNDNIPDWSALVDGRPSRLLYPQDEDIDGDGISNVLDARPFWAAADVSAKPGVPLHLLDDRKEVAQLQQQLFQHFGVLAINHTDRHSAEILRSLLLLLELALPKSLSLDNFRYLYAFRGHDRNQNIAAYHARASAISIGGMQTYPTELNMHKRTRVLAALAHELGHAFVFEKLQPEELRLLGQSFGGWQKTDAKADGFYAPVLLQARNASLDNENMVSLYGMKNMHEWFAEAFAATALRELGRMGHLGRKWRKNLVERPRHGYWVDYNNISAKFSYWLRDRMLR